MLNHELEILFAEQVDPSDNVVSPYIEAVLVGDGDSQLNKWTYYKLEVFC